MSIFGRTRPGLMPGKSFEWMSVNSRRWPMSEKPLRVVPAPGNEWQLEVFMVIATRLCETGHMSLSIPVPYMITCAKPRKTCACRCGWSSTCSLGWFESLSVSHLRQRCDDATDACIHIVAHHLADRDNGRCRRHLVCRFD